MSHDLQKSLLIWFAVQETFIIIINVENSCLVSYFWSKPWYNKKLKRTELILNFRQATRNETLVNYALPDSVYEAKRSSRVWYYQANEFLLLLNISPEYMWLLELRTSFHTGFQRFGGLVKLLFCACRWQCSVLNVSVHQNDVEYILRQMYVTGFTSLSHWRMPHGSLDARELISSPWLPGYDDTS